MLRGSQRQFLLSQAQSANEKRQAPEDFARQPSLAPLDIERILSRSEKSYLCNSCSALLTSWNKLRVQLPEVQQKLSARLAGVHPHVLERPIPRAGDSHAPRIPMGHQGEIVQHVSPRTRRQARLLPRYSSTPISRSRRMDQRSPAVHVRL